MFDIGFSEMVVIAVVALIVIGPERLPGVARTMGALLGRMQRYFTDVKAEVNRELQLEDIRKMQQDLTDKARSLEQSARSELSAFERVIETDQLPPATAGEQPVESKDAVAPPVNPAKGIESGPEAHNEQ